MLDHLADLYQIREVRTGIHLSTLVYCLTRSYLDQTQFIKPTDQEVLLFSLGYGLQDVLTPKEATTPTIVRDGITYRPDMMIDLSGYGLTEIKTTRMSSGKEGFPGTWLEYIMGGCYIMGSTEYDLSVLHMMGNYKPPFPSIKSYKITFTPEEIEDNWQYLMARKDIYEVALMDNVVPDPYRYCKDWECNYCRYKLVCSSSKK
jgi:hypothetical protein